MVLGFFKAKDVDEVRKNARKRYKEQYERIREIVPADQLLEYKLGEGWGPLCGFLGKEVPTVEFPNINETDALRKKAIETQITMLKMTLRKYGLGLLAFTSIASALWWRTR
jgi:hypothetical protein